jgi:hypothetical protein
MKRMTWFVSGAAAGVAGATYARRKVKQHATKLAPTNVARSAAATVKHGVHNVGDALHEGRAAMRAKEAELRARRDGHAVIANESSTGELLVTGEVQPGQVIVLRDVRPRRDPADVQRRRNRR